MEKIIVSRETGKVVGIDRDPMPFEEVIKTPFELNLTKSIVAEVRQRQKINEEGLPLYMDNIVVDEQGNVVSFTETTESRKPVAFETRIVIETRLGSDGTIPSETPTTKEMTTSNTSAESPATNESETTTISPDTTTTESAETAPEEPQVTERVIEVTEAGVVVERVVQIPVEFEDLPPVLIEEPVYKTVRFEDDPTLFTYDEVVEAKKRAIDENSLNTLVYYSERLSSEEFDFTDPNHSADMGVGVVTLHGSGQCRTKMINLGQPAQRLEVYLEADPDVSVEVLIDPEGTTVVPVDLSSGIAVLPNPTDTIALRFINNSDRRREIHAFGILI